MDFVAYNEILICEKPIRNEIVAGKKIGYTFEIRYPSYRGCYLSCIEDLKFEIDGQEIAKEKIAFSLNGKEFTISDLMVAESGVGTIAAGVAKAKADLIVISGAEGGMLYSSWDCSFLGYQA